MYENMGLNDKNKTGRTSKAGIEKPDDVSSTAI
jgi:hypothetical protein